ncbi:MULTISPECIES: shikimate dehydrogenase [Ralstonia solanacearum species complex]|uniref:shikimate dehydrogenase n=1 Tax=Ralstonia solanacearum species complex TaxID=3116862 RepID=UPI000E58E93F|nr:shikimate dehydrogenase [Ralstonia solanacearum]BEU74871.1 shikimate dehydrogenase [Ralstonia pseudosolanacearum]AXV79678.1 shikimate dehydrogenase [Ralstonia solanacearum]AXV93710.1 shikimate dehydrogenase [Ralstonia solanacearum]AXW21709.1 shikimate dehydrogenase [Ralstonia solanacearum]AXW64457.1 shikimate dehydrogenase [Ralstonia solanacearum]
MHDDLRPSLLAGLIGAGIQRSLSPAMHQQEGDAQGLRYVYRIIDLEALGLTPDALPELLTAAERFGFAGLNITHPCKQRVLQYLDDLSDDARALGAVNTVVFKNGRRIGHNTDWWGFAESFRRGLPDVPMGQVVQLGAGGAGAAVAHAVLTLGARSLTLFDVDPERARQLAASLCGRFGPGRAQAGTDLAAAMAAADGLAHATPTGMAGHPGLPLPPDLLRSRHWVAEIVYFPLETELLRHARALGCRTLDGGGMAVFQAVGAFELFTGIAPNAHRMLAHFAALQDAEATASAGSGDPRGIARPGAGSAAVPLRR